MVEREKHVQKTCRKMDKTRSNMNVYLLNLLSVLFLSPSPPSPCYLCSRYWALHGGCVELIRTVIDGRVDDLSFRLNTRLDICLLAAFACFPPVCGNLSQYSHIFFLEGGKSRQCKARIPGKTIQRRVWWSTFIQIIHWKNAVLWVLLMLTLCCS